METAGCPAGDLTSSQDVIAAWARAAFARSFAARIAVPSIHRPPRLLTAPHLALDARRDVLRRCHSPATPPTNPPPPTMYAFVGASAAALSPVRAAPATCVSSFAGARLVAAPRVRPARMSMALGEDGLAEDLSAAKGCIEEGCEINAVQV